MFGPPVTLRCTRCGHFFGVPTPLTVVPAWVPCPHCQQPAPVLAPREPAPLFTWEAFPHLYPSVRLPAPPSPRVGRIGAILLVVVAALLLAGAAGYLIQGASALPNHPYRVAGRVMAANPNGTASVPLAGAVVALRGENGFRASTVTDPAGRFDFTGVPSGGISINVTAPAYAPVTVVIFADPVYSSPTGHPTNLTVDVSPGAASAGSTLEESPFPDLEQFVATVWSGTSILVLGAVVALVGAARAYRRDRPAWGAAGGVAGLIAPAGLYLLGLLGLFPLLDVLMVLVAVLGGVAAVVLAYRLTAISLPMPPD